MSDDMTRMNRDYSRRSFFNQTGRTVLFGSAGTFTLSCAGTSVLAAEGNSEDYRALVCVFLYGGNDHANTIIPYDAANYSRLSQIRPSLAPSRESLGQTLLTSKFGQELTDNQSFALSPHMPRLAARFNSEHLAILLNVGPLLAPITRSGFESDDVGRYPRPAKLFSHNDQQSTWQSFAPDGATSGWGGRIADVMQSSNSNAMFTAINSSSNTIFMAGTNNSPMAIGTGGATRMYPVARPFGSAVAEQEIQSILRQHHGHMFEQDYANMLSRSIEYERFINDRLSSSRIKTDFNTGNRLASELSIVARLIEARREIGVRRQVFFVSLGGFDTHNDQAARHRALLASLDEALESFYLATEELGVAKNVTSFTASDFGRTLSTNGDGTDHGWGGHHFILGGSVKGGRFYGTAPRISIKSDDQVGRGRLIPTTSVDEYSTTLALWLGVSPSNLNFIAPNIGRFAKPDLGFMHQE